MKVYRIHFIGKKLESLGYQFALNSITAGVLAKDIPKGHTAQIETADIELTREGVLHALQRFASHPNNG